MIARSIRLVLGLRFFRKDPLSVNNNYYYITFHFPQFIIHFTFCLNVVFWGVGESFSFFSSSLYYSCCNQGKLESLNLDKFFLPLFEILSCYEIFLVTVFLPLLLECSAEITLISNLVRDVHLYVTNVIYMPR